MVIFCLLIEAMWKISGFDIHFTFIHVIAIMMDKDTGKEDGHPKDNEWRYCWRNGLSWHSAFRIQECRDARLCRKSDDCWCNWSAKYLAGKRAQDLGKVQFIKGFA